MSFWTGMLIGAVIGVVATVGAEFVVACLAYAVYRLLVRLGLVKAQTISSETPV